MGMALEDGMEGVKRRLSRNDYDKKGDLMNLKGRGTVVHLWISFKK